MPTHLRTRGRIPAGSVSRIIYPTAPFTPGLKERVEGYLNEYGLQVVWFDDA